MIYDTNALTVFSCKFVDRIFGGPLDDQNFRRPPHSFCRQLWISELRILTAEIFFDHPTGSRTCLSNEDRNLKFHHFSQRLTKGWPTNWSHAIGDGCAHEHRGISS